ncbi:MAG: aromatic amino acid transaminase [Caulobacteraceae bacterium]
MGWDREVNAMLDALQVQPADPLLSVTAAFRADDRERKIDLGVGVFRDATGRTPVMKAVKAAERALHEAQITKDYVGGRGDARFVELIEDLALGVARPSGWGIQTPGGTAALRLAADLLVRGGARAITYGTPTWANHQPVFRAAGLGSRTFEAFDAETQSIDFEAVREAFGAAGRGEAVLVQASCHNPTGVDFTAGQWESLAALIAERGLVPLIDAAYLGLGDELEEDARGLRAVVAAAPVSFVAVSCSKSFGLYRERTGALLASFNAAHLAEPVITNALAIARANYSMPPDHGAAVARMVLETAVLRSAWLEELAEMRDYIAALRRALAAHGRAGAIDLAPLGRQRGMFSQLPLSPDQVARLRERHGVYVTGAGRVNVAGLALSQIDEFAGALAEVTAG